jgi:hypothetical protein
MANLTVIPPRAVYGLPPGVGGFEPCVQAGSRHLSWLEPVTGASDDPDDEREVQTVQKGQRT